MALMNWSKSCSSGALVAVIGILEYLRINTVVIIPSCTCSRTKPPIQMAVWLDKHSFPTLQRKDCVTNPKEVRFAMVHYLFSGGGEVGNFCGHELSRHIQIVHGFLIGNACARILQGLDSTPRAPLSRWLDRTLQKIKDKVVPDVLNNFSIKEENIRMISVNMNKIPRNKMLQKICRCKTNFHNYTDLYLPYLRKGVRKICLLQISSKTHRSSSYVTLYGWGSSSNVSTLLQK